MKHFFNWRQLSAKVLNKCQNMDTVIDRAAGARFGRSVRFVFYVDTALVIVRL